MPLTVSLARSAIDDLHAMQAWYLEQGVPQVGKRLGQDILARVERLADNSAMGRIVPEFQQPSLRELIIPPFRVVYRLETDAVRVVRVWRCERLLKLPGNSQ